MSLKLNINVTTALRFSREKRKKINHSFRIIENKKFHQKVPFPCDFKYLGCAFFNQAISILIN